MARKTKREILEVAIANAQKAGDTAAVAQLQAVLDSLPAPRGGDKLRAAAARPASTRSARTVLKVQPRRPARDVLGVAQAGPDLEEQGYDDEQREDPEAPPADEPVEVPEALSPAFRVQYKEYLQQANAINKVGRTAASLDALIQKLDEEQGRGGSAGHDPMLFGAPPRGSLPGAGGPANVVGGALENVANTPVIGGLAGVITRPLGGALRKTTKEGQELRQFTHELELLGANMLVKGTGQISDKERAMVRDTWGLDTTDPYADRNIRIGVKKALADASQAMKDLESSYPDVAEYTRRLGHSSSALGKDLESAYDPMSVYEER